LKITACSKPSLDGGRPVVLVGDQLVPLDVNGIDGVAAAINGRLAGDEPTFAGVRLRNVPNPFNPATEIRFDLPRRGLAEVRIYDVGGREVRRLGREVLEAGPHAFSWNGTDNHRAPVVSGVYFYRLYFEGGPLGSPVKMTLVK
jgi:hypothetical protein